MVPRSWLSSARTGGFPAREQVVVIGDSLTFHGPDQAHPPSDRACGPNIAAQRLGTGVDVAAGVGWTARATPGGR